MLQTMKAKNLFAAKLRKAGMVSADSVLGDVDMKFQQSILCFFYRIHSNYGDITEKFN